MDTITLAKQIRTDALNLTFKAKASHIGSILSVADIVAVLYGKILRVDPKNPRWENRDRFILSKGHSGVAVYSALAHTGFFDPNLLDKYYTFGSTLSGHVSHKGNLGVECSTGSLGQGVTVAVGMALAGKMNHKKHRVFAVLGEGECEEGSVWEACAFAGSNNLDNLVLVVDYNLLQIFGKTNEIIDQSKLVNKFRAFGFDVVSVNGHNHKELIDAFSLAPTSKPLAVVCKTVKGKGVSFMENKPEWHGKTVNEEELKLALKEVEGGKDA